VDTTAVPVVHARFDIVASKASEQVAGSSENVTSVCEMHESVCEMHVQ
jgi:hypothetical protein